MKITDDVKQRKQKHFKQYRTAKQKLTNKENLARFLHRGKPEKGDSIFGSVQQKRNVKFFGIKENSESSEGDVSTHPENTKDIIYNFMEQELKIDNARDRITFQRIHRLGKPNTNGSRPIIARFLRYSDKEEVMSKARQHLKGKDFFVYDDIPKELYDLRKKQQKKFQDALSKGYKAHFSKAHPDQLFINGKYIAPDTPLE